MRHVLLALFAVFCYTYAMTYPTIEPGYTARERDGMERLVADAVEPQDWLVMLTEKRSANH